MISLPILTHSLNLLIDSGEFKPKNTTRSTQLEDPEEDIRPRGRDGKLLTAAQIAWGEMARFAEVSTSDVIRERCHTDKVFADFVRTNLRREMNEQPVETATPAGAPTGKARATQELIDFARKYNKEWCENLRPKGGFVTLEGEQIP